MQKFNLDTWLKDKSRKIVTRTGKPVRIVCWDSPNEVFPIVGFIDNEPEIFTWDCFGYCREGHIENENDLFFEDKERKELTEFEKELQTIISEGSYWTSDDGSMSSCCLFGDKEIKKISTQILDLAREEILKDLPKWEKSHNNPKLSEVVPYLGDYVLYWKGYYIQMKDLEKLPKEE